MTTTTKCYECGKSMTEKIIDYHYTESGLLNVYLKGVTEFTCKSCGESFVDIPEPVQLHIILAIVISNSPDKLTGLEIRFLRKEVEMTGKAFAKFIGVDPVTLSRWENDKANRGESHDRLIRLAFKVMICEKLKAIVQCVERSITKSEVVHIRKHRLDIDTDAMKYVFIPALNDMNIAENNNL